jgi:hypothetical protein
MSGNSIAALSGATACLAKAGLKIGSTATEVATAAPNGAGLDFCIDGIAYYKVDDATATLTAAAQQGLLTSCLYLVSVDSSAVISSVKGKEEVTTELGDNLSLQWPQPLADTCPIGGFKIALVSAATFTCGTTDLDASDVTATYYDFSLGIPNTPVVA